jgi:hypothetical protein
VKAVDLLGIRATFLESISWADIVQLNKARCSLSSGVVHGFNGDSAAAVRDRWEKTRREKISILELLDFLYRCHKQGPFLNFNGNVFGEVARQILATSMLGMPVVRIEAATSLAAHFVAGVLDRDEASKGIQALLVVGVLKSGDRVATLQFTRQGQITRVLADGRVAWLPDGRKAELLAMPEALIKLEPGRKVPKLD